jgi:inner membrane protein YidH
MSSEEKLLKTSDELAQDRTNLAYDRTELANDRTLMAWVRTATSLISFGFTIYKFFQDIFSSDNTAASNRLLGPREVGMMLILFGFVGLFFGLLQYHKDMKRIRQSYPEKKEFSFAPVLAILMLILSLLLFLAALFKQ